LQSRLTRQRFVALTATGAAVWPLVARARSAPFGFVGDEMRWAGVPGASLATVSVTSIDSASFGMRDVAAHLPVTAATLFEAGSLSKPVFAYAVLELVLAGRLDLERPLDSYVPSPYPIDDPRGSQITARHVLTHTSGLPNWRPGDKGPLKLQFTPGSQYLYSGEGYYFLQTVVEHITGQSTDEFMRVTLNALGMHASSYIWRGSDLANCALPYAQDGRALTHDTAVMGQQLVAMGKAMGQPLATWRTSQALAALSRLHPPLAPVPHNAMPNAAWSLLTTARDYARFVQTLLRQPKSPMLQPLVQVGPYVWRGLGVSLQKNGGVSGFFHTGSNPGFKSVMFGDLRNGRGVVSFTNSGAGFPFNMHVVDDVLGPQAGVFYLELP
jgi:CubicO group peptidase (beta-lactamase class C family)